MYGILSSFYRFICNVSISKMNIVCDIVTKKSGPNLVSKTNYYLFPEIFLFL